METTGAWVDGESCARMAVAGHDPEIELELDDGSRTTVGAGGIIVQRGTNHLWRNNTDRPCRIAFVLIEAKAYVYDGVPLGEHKP